MAKRETDFCPECGATFRAGRLACPECGSDYDTGWKGSEEIDYASVEIPDAWPPESPRRGRPLFVIVILLTALGFVLLALWR